METSQIGNAAKFLPYARTNRVVRDAVGISAICEPRGPDGCLLLAQSGHAALRIVATQNDRSTPFRRPQIPAVIASFQSIVRTGLRPWGRQCDDAPSLKEFPLWRRH